MTDYVERRLREGGLNKTEVSNLQRRLFLRHGLSFGALSLLTGCDVVTNTRPVDGFLRAVSRFNDGVQSVLFNPHWSRPSSASTRNTAWKGYRTSIRPRGACGRRGSSPRRSPGLSSSCGRCRNEPT
jgi:hypothetical protein